MANETRWVNYFQKWQNNSQKVWCNSTKDWHFMDCEGRVGVVTGIVKAFGGSSKHMIFFDGASKPENVLLQKSTDGRGVRFHVLEQGGSQFRSQSS